MAVVRRYVFFVVHEIIYFIVNVSSLIYCCGDMRYMQVIEKKQPTTISDYLINIYYKTDKNSSNITMQDQNE